MDKRKILRISLITALLLVLVVFFVIINEMITEHRRSTFIPISDGDEYAYQIEEVAIDKDELVIKGWFFELKKVKNLEREVETNEFGIVLFDINSKQEYELNKDNNTLVGSKMYIQYYDRPDVNKYFDCEYDYTHCGFIARIDKSQVDLINGEYLIVFKPNTDGDKGIFYDSNAYLDKGSFSYINPQDKIDMDVINTDLENIVNKGTCLASYPQFSIYIYQYKWDLYWIAGPDYNFESDKNTYIEYHIYTTQYEYLPEERKLNGWYWSNIGDDFEKNEITEEMECGKYRVSRRSLPDAYSIVRIVTGYFYDGKYIWYRALRPDYLRKND